MSTIIVTVCLKLITIHPSINGNKFAPTLDHQNQSQRVEAVTSSKELESNHIEPPLAIINSSSTFNFTFYCFVETLWADQPAMVVSIIGRHVLSSSPDLLYEDLFQSLPTVQLNRHPLGSAVEIVHFCGQVRVIKNRRWSYHWVVLIYSKIHSTWRFFELLYFVAFPLMLTVMLLVFHSFSFFLWKKSF